MKARAPAYWRTACAELAAVDPVMAGLIARYPDCVLGNRGDPFQTLARAIVGQQISIKAADSIWSRFERRAGRVEPARVASLALEDLAVCGLSRRKAEYLTDLAGHFVDERIQPARWARMADEAVIAELTDVRGIGRWTAEVFLIFQLQRLDVFPAADLALLTGIQRVYRKRRRPTPAEARRFAERWRPYRSIASWYLWRSIEP